MEYVFIPIINSIGTKITIENNNGKKTIKIIDPNIEIPMNSSGHITSIDDRGKIRNVLVITNYAVDENSGKLIPTLDPCDYVKGILVAVNGQLQPQSILKSSQSILLKLKLQTSKLYILRKGEIPNELTVNIFIDRPPSSDTINTKFKTINDNLDKVYDFFNKIYQIDKFNQEKGKKDIEEKVKKDIQELFNYYALSDKLS
jgi:hypothetical protein